MGGAKDVDEHLLVRGYPFDRWQSADGAVEPFAWYSFLHDEYEQTGEETLEDVKKVGYGRDCVAHAGEDGRVEDHLPLDTAIWTEEGRSIHRYLKAHSGTGNAIGARGELDSE